MLIDLRQTFRLTAAQISLCNAGYTSTYAAPADCSMIVPVGKCRQTCERRPMVIVHVAEHCTALYDVSHYGAHCALAQQG